MHEVRFTIEGKEDYKKIMKFINNDLTVDFRETPIKEGEKYTVTIECSTEDLKKLKKYVDVEEKNNKKEKFWKKIFKKWW